ncbi:MAG: MBL fold metallo-hydrolase [bacterium]
MGYEIDFLPVGDGERSGDAIAIRIGELTKPSTNRAIIVIDGGFTESGERLVEHIKTFYETDFVDLVVSTHPDDDHISGLRVVLENLRVGELWMHRPWHHSREISKLAISSRVTDSGVKARLQKSLTVATELEELAESKGIPIVEPFAGVSKWGSIVRVVGPTQEYYESLLPEFRGTPATRTAESSLLERLLEGAKGVVKRIAEAWDIETLGDDGETTAENNTSAVVLITFNDKHLLFTGDAGIPALTAAADEIDALGFFRPDHLRFIQVPHHGSRRNVGPTILNRIVGPKLAKETARMTAFVSVSKGAGEKHPSKKVTNAFRRRGAPVHSTQGTAKWHHFEAPTRGTYSTSDPLPLYTEVED